VTPNPLPRDSLTCADWRRGTVCSPSCVRVCVCVCSSRARSPLSLPAPAVVGVEHRVVLHMTTKVAATRTTGIQYDLHTSLYLFFSGLNTDGRKLLLGAGLNPQMVDATGWGRIDRGIVRSEDDVALAGPIWGVVMKERASLVDIVNAATSPAPTLDAALENFKKMIAAAADIEVKVASTASKWAKFLRIVDRCPEMARNTYMEGQLQQGLAVSMDCFASGLVRLGEPILCGNTSAISAVRCESELPLSYPQAVEFLRRVSKDTAAQSFLKQLHALPQALSASLAAAAPAGDGDSVMTVYGSSSSSAFAASSSSSSAAAASVPAPSLSAGRGGRADAMKVAARGQLQPASRGSAARR
jgi:hypothetical protein